MQLSLIAAITSSTLFGKAFHQILECFCPLGQKSHCMVNYLLWIRRSGLRMAFQIIPVVINRVEVRALCRPEFLHTNMVKPGLYEADFLYTWTQ